MGTVLGIIVLIVVLPYFASRISQARSSAWTGPRTPAMRARATSPGPARGALGKTGRTAARSSGTAVLNPRSRHARAQAKADIDRLVAEFGLTDWLEERREERAERKEERARMARAGATPEAGRAAPAPHRPAPAAGMQPPPASAVPASPQPAPSGSNGGTPVAAGTSTAGAEQVIEGIDRLVARAMAGNILTKREAMLALHEALTRGAIAVTGLSRDMAEPGSNYGPEITEPLAKSGTQMQAAAMCLADADAALVALLKRSVAEMATSPQRTPHHQNELSESGAR